MGCRSPSAYHHVWVLRQFTLLISLSFLIGEMLRLDYSVGVYSFSNKVSGNLHDLGECDLRGV